MNSFSFIFAIIIQQNYVSISSSDIIQWITIRYPGIGEDYVKVLKNSKGIPMHSFLFDLNKVQREELCKEVAGAIIFEYLHPDGGWPIPILRTEHDYDAIVARVEEFYGRSLFSSFHKFVLKVEIDRRIILVDAVPCFINETVNDAWFLGPGLEENSLIALVKRGNFEHYIVMGQTEPSPSLDSRTLNNQTSLEETFILGFKDIPDISHKRSVCALSTMRKLRLCSTIFPTYATQKERVKFYAVNHLRGKPKCLEKITVAFRDVDLLSIGHNARLQTDLLVCAVNEEWFSPRKFYVTLDPKVWHAVYVLEYAVLDPPVDANLDSPSSCSSVESSSTGASDDNRTAGKQRVRKVKFFLGTSSEEAPETGKRDYYLKMRIKHINLLRYHHVRI